MDENLKLIAAITAAGSLGGFGGHSIGSTDFDSVTIESCAPFVEHARQHASLVCEDQKLKISNLCEGVELWQLRQKTLTQ